MIYEITEAQLITLRDIAAKLNSDEGVMLWLIVTEIFNAREAGVKFILKLDRRNGREYWAAGSLIGHSYTTLDDRWGFRPAIPASIVAPPEYAIIEAFRQVTFSCEQSVYCAALIWANEQRAKGWL